VRTTTAVVVLVLIAAHALALASVAYRRRKVPGALALMAVMGSVAWWSLAYAGELAVAGRSDKILLSELEYVGIVTLPAALLVAVCQTTGVGPRLDRRRLGLLALPAVAMLALVVTNGAHRLVWRTATIGAELPHDLSVTHGAAFWVHAGWSYVLLATALGVLVRAVAASPERFRPQLGSLALSVGAPIIANIVYLTDIPPAPQFDPTPFAFAISAAALAYGLFRFRAFDAFLGLVPVAREALIKDMSDAVVVLDGAGAVVEANVAAHRLVAPGSVGLAAALERWPSELRTVGAGATRAEVEHERRGRPVVLDVQASALRDRGDRVVGRLVVARNWFSCRRRAGGRRTSCARARPATASSSRARTTSSSASMRTAGC